MQDKFLKGFYRLFSITFFVSSLVYAGGGCKIHKHVDENDDKVTITSTSNPELEDLCKSKEKLEISSSGNSESTTK